MKTIRPNRRYFRKLVTIYSLVSAIILIFAFAVGALIGRGDPAGGRVFTLIFASTAALLWIVAVSVAGPYARSLEYEIREDEVVVRVGILTKSVKHVPYRTVTNLKINRGLLDRFLFDLGSLNIQTAGMSGSTGAEESLVGLEKIQEIYEDVAGRLRSFRGGMPPTAAGEDSGGISGSGTLIEILDELRQIRKTLEK